MRPPHGHDAGEQPPSARASQRAALSMRCAAPLTGSYRRMAGDGLAPGGASARWGGWGGWKGTTLGGRRASVSTPAMPAPACTYPRGVAPAGAAMEITQRETTIVAEASVCARRFIVERRV